MGDSRREVWHFTHALVRAPSASAVNGLRMVDRGLPLIDALKAEHAAYADALRTAGVTVDILPPLEEFPDSVFVEDPALVLAEGAIVLRPGAASRFGEAAAIAPALRARFETVHELPGPGFVDGGDVLVTSDTVFIGLSGRTDRAGGEALATLLRGMGRSAEVVAPPPGVLHLKSACALLDGDTVLVTGALAESDILGRLRMLRVPAGEEAAANALRVNGTVFLAAGHPRTAEFLARSGYHVEELAVTDVAKLDAGLSCMSLRW